MSNLVFTESVDLLDKAQMNSLGIHKAAFESPNTHTHTHMTKAMLVHNGFAVGTFLRRTVKKRQRGTKSIVC